MIKSNKGTTKIKGNVVEILSDFGVIAKSIMDAMEKDGFEKEYIVERLKENIEFATLSDEERMSLIMKKMNERIAEFLEKEREEEHE